MSRFFIVERTKIPAKLVPKGQQVGDLIEQMAYLMHIDNNRSVFEVDRFYNALHNLTSFAHNIREVESAQRGRVAGPIVSWVNDLGPFLIITRWVLSHLVEDAYTDLIQTPEDAVLYNFIDRRIATFENDHVWFVQARAMYNMDPTSLNSMLHAAELLHVHTIYSNATV